MAQQVEQLAAESIIVGDPTGRVQQIAGEVLYEGVPKGQVLQAVAEVLIRMNPPVVGRAVICIMC